MKTGVQKRQRTELAVLKLLMQSDMNFSTAQNKIMLGMNGKPALSFNAEIVDDLARRGLVIKEKNALHLSETGCAYLLRQLQPQDPHRAQHVELKKKTIRDDAQGSHDVTINLHESPLAWLRTRRDKNGRAMLSETQFAAGEKLRAEFTRARLDPKISSNWDFFSAQNQRGLPPSGHFSDGTLAAKNSVNEALKAVGPELSGVLLDVCCFLKGLSAVESERRWPARSAKIILTLALDRLAVHYGFTAEAVGKNSGKIRSWGAEDARPGIVY